MDGNPFACPIEESLGCELRMEGGVMHIYKNEEMLEANKPIELPYPELATFLADQNIMFALIADGPLYVSLPLHQHI